MPTLRRRILTPVLAPVIMTAAVVRWLRAPDPRPSDALPDPKPYRPSRLHAFLDRIAA